MKFWMLQRIARFDKKKDTVIVRAATEKRARELAASSYDDSARYDLFRRIYGPGIIPVYKNVWLDETASRCARIYVDGAEDVLFDNIA